LRTWPLNIGKANYAHAARIGRNERRPMEKAAEITPVPMYEYVSGTTKWQQ